MPSKIKPTSLRLPPGLRPVVHSYMEQQGLALHPALVRLVKIGLEHDFKPVTTPSPREVLAAAEAKAAHLALPKPKPRRSRSRWVFKNVQLGPSESPAGSRLKGAPPRKANR